MQIGKESIVISFNVENRGETNIVERNKRDKGNIGLGSMVSLLPIFFFFFNRILFIEIFQFFIIIIVDNIIICNFILFCIITIFNNINFQKMVYYYHRTYEFFKIIIHLIEYR